MSRSELETHVLVVGAGMAGLSAAAYAASHGAEVIVAEKADEIGGSAVLSGGGLWTATSLEAYQALDPKSDPGLVRLLVEGFPDAVDWVKALGVDIAPPRSTDAIQGYPSAACVFDNYTYLQRCRSVVQEAGGWVVTNCDVQKLQIVDGRIAGALITDRDGEATIRAKWTVLATGGFQGSPSLRAELIGSHAAELPLRANSASDGGGLRLAKAVGASLRVDTENFYGHLMPSPLPADYGPSHFLRLAQIYSPRTLLLDRDGHRFVDESKSYYNNAVAVSRLPGRRAVLVGDEVVREVDRTMYGPASESIDRPLEALREGGRVVIADSLEEVNKHTEEWGYTGVAEAVLTYNRQIQTPEQATRPTRMAHRVAYVKPPFFAMEVQPAITFSFGGLRADANARVLDESGRPIPGLLAAGVDIGVYDSVYAGGLAFGLVTGITAARTALRA